MNLVGAFEFSSLAFAGVWNGGQGLATLVQHAVTSGEPRVSYIATSNHYLSVSFGLLWLGIMLPEQGP